MKRDDFFFSFTQIGRRVGGWCLILLFLFLSFCLCFFSCLQCTEGNGVDCLEEEWVGVLGALEGFSEERKMELEQKKRLI